MEEGIEIGLIPDLPRDCITMVGNAAGKGAIVALLSHFQRKRAEDCIRKISYIELSNNPNFRSLFAANMTL